MEGNFILAATGFIRLDEWFIIRLRLKSCSEHKDTQEAFPI